MLVTITFVHNALVSIDGQTAYNALLGRQPAILPSIAEGTVGEMEDSLARGETHSRYQARVREIATSKIVEASAKQRMQLVDTRRARPSMQLSDIQIGQEVDIWFDPSQKDQPGFRGPAKVASIQPQENVVTVRYQGRTLDCLLYTSPSPRD